MTTLAIDIGNSNIVIGMYAGDDLRHVFRYPSDSLQPDTFYIHGLQEVLLEWQVHPSEIKQVGVSSVVPDLTQMLSQALQSLFGFAPHVLGPTLYESLPFVVPKPYEIGSDIVANAIAVHHRYAKDSIIVDFGTALTFTVYTHATGIEGVTIAPGINTAIKSLAGSTAQLPEAEVTLPKSVIGKDTQHAIQAGILHGYTGLAKHLITAIKEELDADCLVVATGGMSTCLPLDEVVDLSDKGLTLDGIRLACQYV